MTPVWCNAKCGCVSPFDGGKLFDSGQFIDVRKLKCIAYTNVLSPGNYLSSKDHVEFTQLERVNIYSPIGSGLRRRAQI